MIPSPLPDVQVPDRTLPDYVFGELPAEYEGKTAITDGRTAESLTYGELVSGIHRAGELLVSRGLRAGETVAVCLPNSPEYPVALYGALRAGAAVTPVGWAAGAGQIAARLLESRASYVLTSATARDRARHAAGQAGFDPGRVLAADDPCEEPMAAGGAGGTPGPDDIALMPYSSGTTGTAKGVLLTHRNLVANSLQSAGLLDIRPDDVTLGVVPFAHIFGLSLLVVTALRQRAGLVTLERFDLDEFLRAIERYRCSYVVITPPIAVALAKSPSPSAYDLSSLRVLFSGAAALDAGVASAVEDRLGCEVRQGYGMTELSPTSHVTPSPRGGIRRGSVGLLVPNCRQRIVDVEAGAEIPQPAAGLSAPGELQVSGPNVMAGYKDDPAATGHAITGDGFLRTGDLAAIDADGAVSIVGRIKDLIKSRGFQVAPAEIEAVLLEHEEVADAAVIGVPSEPDGEAPAAVVVRRAGSAIGADELLEYCNRRLPAHCRVRRLDFSPVIPRSGSGKILRRELIRDYGAPAQGGDIVDHIVRYLRGGAEPGQLDVRLGVIENGLDSLTVIELRNRISEEMGVTLTTTELIGDVTLAELADQIGAAG